MSFHLQINVQLLFDWGEEFLKFEISYAFATSLKELQKIKNFINNYSANETLNEVILNQKV